MSRSVQAWRQPEGITCPRGCNLVAPMKHVSQCCGSRTTGRNQQQFQQHSAVSGEPRTVCALDENTDPRSRALDSTTQADDVTTAQQHEGAPSCRDKRGSKRQAASLLPRMTDSRAKGGSLLWGALHHDINSRRLLSAAEGKPARLAPPHKHCCPGEANPACVPCDAACLPKAAATQPPMLSIRSISSIPGRWCLAGSEGFRLGAAATAAAVAALACMCGLTAAAAAMAT